MFYFTGDVLLSFQLTYNGGVITPEASIQIYSGDTLIETGVPVLVGQYYNYVPNITDDDILPNYYSVYRFVVTAQYGLDNIISNGFFIVHVAEYDNLDNTTVFLSNQDSEIYLECKVLDREDCLSQPPVKPNIMSVEMFRSTNSSCDCSNNK